MKNKNKRTIGLICLAVVIFFTASISALNFSINRALSNNAEKTGINWSKHIAHHIPDLGDRQYYESFKNLQGALRTENLARLATDIVKTSDVFQIDVVNSDCYCSISLGSYFTKHNKKSQKILVRRTHAKPDKNFKTDTFKEKASSLPPHFSHSVMKHILTSKKKLHKAWQTKGKSLQQVSIDWMKSARIASDHQTRTYVQTGDGIEAPTVYAEVFYSVKINGKVMYILRTLVNIEASAASYTLYHYGGFTLIMALLGGFFAVPARNYWLAREQSLALEKKASFFETYDPLTKVLNRNALHEAAEAQLKITGKDSSPWVLTLVELRNLAEINDISSHNFGDTVLQEMAAILEAQCGKRSIIGRISGATFAILMPQYLFNKRQEFITPKLKHGFQMDIENRKVLVDLNSGSAQYPEHADTFDNLLRNASLTLKQTQEIGVNIHKTFTPDFASAHRARAALKRSFKNAILSQQIMPYYQPIINAETGQLVGLEALARWMHPVKGVLSPAAFFTALEDPEISALLGKEMIRLVTGHMGFWKAEKVPFGYVGVNINDGDLERKGFVLETAKAIADNGLYGPNLSLEVSENCIFGKNSDDYLKKLTLLKDAGCRIALDDFGTGHSSISLLKNVPFDTVKIDRSFIIDIENNPKDRAIVKALTDLSQSMEFKLIAEGVETDEQLETTKNLGVSLIQGFLFAQPMPMSEVVSFIKTAQRSAIPVKMVS
ncbi:MAG: bifunctional diguanylate cyclase/phosphodiesterase [Hyphomicrobiales bacterium]